VAAMLAALFVPIPAHSEITRALSINSVIARSVTQNALVALLEPADVIIASPIVVIGTVQVRRQAGTARGEAIEIAASTMSPLVRRHSPIDLDLSSLRLELGQYTQVLAGLRYRPADGAFAWMLTAGRDGLLFPEGSDFARILPDGTLQRVPSPAAIRCSLSTSSCYVSELAARGIVTPLERRAFAHRKVDDPLLPLLYLVAYRANLVRRFPTRRCVEPKWSCASSSVYRQLLHYGLSI
jgi:hypothetical protein